MWGESNKQLTSRNDGILMSASGLDNAQQFLITHWMRNSFGCLSQYFTDSILD